VAVSELDVVYSQVDSGGTDGDRILHAAGGYRMMVDYFLSACTGEHDIEPWPGLQLVKFEA
jgi:hypothetical protein